MRNFILRFLAVLFLTILISSCKNYTDEEIFYIEKIEQFRKDKDNMMRNDPNSPFDDDAKRNFHPLKYYDVDPNFVFKSKLVENEVQDTVIIYGTKGEERVAVRFGYLPFSKDNNSYRLNVYKNIASNGQTYFSTWFTDKTTAEDTYGVGRYLEFDYNENPDFEYTIDFNLAFNPYCAYSPNYSCAIPSKKDFINLEITAGEKKYHD